MTNKNEIAVLLSEKRGERWFPPFSEDDTAKIWAVIRECGYQPRILEIVHPKRTLNPIYQSHSSKVALLSVQDAANLWRKLYGQCQWRMYQYKPKRIKSLGDQEWFPDDRGEAWQKHQEEMKRRFGTIFSQ